MIDKRDAAKFSPTTINEYFILESDFGEKDPFFQVY